MLKSLIPFLVDTGLRLNEAMSLNWGTAVDRHVAARDVRKLCTRLGIERPERVLHAFRHTFSVNYVRKGGSVFHLQKSLGHSSLEMSRRYANLMTEDLQAIHQRVSLLAS
jgi:integrase/recombinase XerD